MRPSEGVAQLARHVLATHAEQRSVPILLGHLCSERAGVPTVAEMGRRAIEGMFRDTPDYAERTFRVRPGAPDSDMESAFLAWLGTMTNRQRYRVMEPFYRQVPVPIFYQDLADLVVAGYFSHVLTTNTDSLLEQALDDLGLRRDHDYQVTVLLPPDEASPDPPQTAPVTVIKLHGDMLSSWLPQPDDIEQALHANRSLLKGELKREVVVVGHTVRGAAIDAWLARGQGDRSWWVHPVRPDAAPMSAIEANRRLVYLDGEEGEPGSFFGQLATHLLRLPTVQVLSNTGAGYPTGTSPGDDYPELPPDVIAQEFYRGRIEKAQVGKYAVQKGTGPGGPGPAYQAQIDYQVEQAADYGTQYLLDEATPQPDVVLGRLAEEFTALGEDPSMSAFLSTQASVVQRELTMPAPNRIVLLAALQAASTVCQSVSREPTGVLAELVDQLNLSVLALAPLGK